ncbi:hypothetical protein A2791_00615 [Candidatus Saccharibacteria bacterium RIFCSPHIGHO2_01_FULL_46_30]|nr:MAG: hypothetical protein A2791_00615 [Candidatus Saccharibacteria bacterium RIFCSPHIGHO2_01_FULL_46_30]
MYLAREVSEGETARIDDRILLAINHRATTTLDTIVVWATELGGVIAVSTISLLLIALYAFKKQWRSAAMIALSIGGAGVLNFGLKLLFERSRPELWTHLVTESSYSFPSGHAMLSSALALALVSIFWGTKYRVAVAIVAALYIAMIGFTRLYLGVHYPSDIIAGWCASFAWVIIVTGIAHTFFTNRQERVDNTTKN